MKRIFTGCLMAIGIMTLVGVVVFLGIMYGGPIVSGITNFGQGVVALATQASPAVGQQADDPGREAEGIADTDDCPIGVMATVDEAQWTLRGTTVKISGEYEITSCSEDNFTLKGVYNGNEIRFTIPRSDLGKTITFQTDVEQDAPLSESGWSLSLLQGEVSQNFPDYADAINNRLLGVFNQNFNTELRDNIRAGVFAEPLFTPIGGGSELYDEGFIWIGGTGMDCGAEGGEGVSCAITSDHHFQMLMFMNPQEATMRAQSLMQPANNMWSVYFGFLPQGTVLRMYRLQMNTSLQVTSVEELANGVLGDLGQVSGGPCAGKQEIVVYHDSPATQQWGVYWISIDTPTLASETPPWAIGINQFRTDGALVCDQDDLQ